uniref:T6PP_N domain-containing protein n=2 Tax=Caenorhabditis tropicalis TaxID=1561998 RepID=A0A1I7T9V9_9PELO
MMLYSFKTLNKFSELRMTIASQSIEEFKECLYRMQDARKSVTKEILDTGRISLEKVEIFKNTLMEMRDGRTSDKHIRDIHSRGTTFGINIQDEIKGLQKDHEFLDAFAQESVREDTFANRLKICNLPGLLSKFSNDSEGFDEEVTNCKAFLKGLIEPHKTGKKPLFITDWDGTMKDYCSQYATNLQPAYSAIVMGDFARCFTRAFAVLTAGPLRHPGILDLTALPIDGPVLFSGSWGREWWLKGRRVVHDDGIPEEGSVAIGQLYEQLDEILHEGEFVQFALVGSGVQKKVDRLTLGVQTVFGQVPEDLSARYIDAVRERIHRVDPYNQYLVLENCSPLEIEVCVHSSGAVWNKGDGVAALVESNDDSLKLGKVCVAGDTASDVPMLQRAAEENPDEVRALFVNVNAQLQKTITNIVGDKSRVCFISCPDVAHAAFAQLICEHQ